MKNGGRALTVILIITIILITLIYVFDGIVNGSSPLESLARLISPVCACIAAFFATRNGGKRSSLSELEAFYAEDLKPAFPDSRRNKRQLLRAIRFYNENNLKKAVNILNNLKPKCKTLEDARPIGIFMALSFSDAGIYKSAIECYKELIEIGVRESRLYSNLGSLYTHIKEFTEANSCLQTAIRLDPQNPYPHNNLANLYFEKRDLESAIAAAREAVKIAPDFPQPNVLLAIAYAVLEDSANAEKYLQIAVDLGEDIQAVENAISQYKAAES